MDILSIKEMRKFIYALETYKAKQLPNINVLEPKIFELLIIEKSPSKILEIGRIANNCSQICEKYNIDYKCVSLKSTKDTCFEYIEWDGDIIYSNPSRKNIDAIIEQSLSILQEGCWFAILQDLTFLNSARRYKKLFQKYSLSHILCHPLKIKISRNGSFDKQEYFTYHKGLYWFIFEKNNLAVNPKIKWLQESAKIIREKYKNTKVNISVDKQFKVPIVSKYINDDFTKRLFPERYF